MVRTPASILFALLIALITTISLIALPAYADDQTDGDNQQSAQSGEGSADQDLDSPENDNSSPESDGSGGEGSADQDLDSGEGDSNTPSYAPGWNLLSDGSWIYVGQDSEIVTGWILEKGHWYWMDPADNGKMATGMFSANGASYIADAWGHLRMGGWVLEGDSWYYASGSGALAEGWLLKGGEWYWMDPTDNGKMVTGLHECDGSMYHFAASGEMSTKWIFHENSWYWANSSGAIQVGWVQVSGEWYWMDPADNGKMVTGLFEVNGKRYVANSDGSLKTDSWHTIETEKYRLGPDGDILNGWFTYDGKKYWLDPEKDGAVATGPLTIDGIYYLATEDGSLATGLWIEKDGKKLFAGLDGAFVHEAVYTTDGSGLILVDGSGNPLTGLQMLSGFFMYASPEATDQLELGQLVKGEFELNGEPYKANDDYVIISGWVSHNGDKYRTDPVTGKMATSWTKIDDTWYFFSDSGVMATGWVLDEGSWYYLHEDGKMATGWLELDSTWYYLKDNGVMLSGGWFLVDGGWMYFTSSGAWVSPEPKMTSLAQSMYSSTSWLIMVDSDYNYVGIYYGSKGNWELQKLVRCTTGLPETPTPKGSFTIAARGMHFGEEKGYTCWYWTQFYGNYLFHSVLYYPWNMEDIQDGRLGIRGSHGCIRLDIDEAKWIYDNIPWGTKVRIY